MVSVMTDLTALASHDEDGVLLAVVECPQGTRHKSHYVPALDSFVLGHRLPTGSVFPYEFGFIPGTKADDGDPVDVLVLADEPTFPGCVIPVRLLGVLEATQQKPGEGEVRNDRLIAIAVAAEEFGARRTLAISGRCGCRRSRTSSSATTRSRASGSGSSTGVGRASRSVSWKPASALGAEPSRAWHGRGRTARRFGPIGRSREHAGSIGCRTR